MSQDTSVAFKFCQLCNNLLYPREDKQTKTLIFSCRHCEHEEESNNPLVFRHVVVSIPIEQTMVIADLATDPTLPRTRQMKCPECGHEEAVFFQSGRRGADTSMKLYFVCTNKACNHRWSSDAV